MDILPDAILVAVFQILVDAPELESQLAAIHLSMASKRFRELALGFIPDRVADLYDACQLNKLLLVHNWVVREENGYVRANALVSACGAGNIAITKFILRKGSFVPKYMMRHAFASGNKDMINLIINQYLIRNISMPWRHCLDGILMTGNHTLFNQFSHNCAPKLKSLTFACLGGNLSLVTHYAKLVTGAINWNSYIHDACKSGNSDLVKYVIASGADDFEEGFRGACDAGNVEIARLLIKYDMEITNQSTVISMCKLPADVVRQFAANRRFRVSTDSYVSALCRAGRSDILETLGLSSIFSVMNQMSKESILAYSCPYPKIVRMILPLIDNPNWNNIFDEIQYCHPESARLLINRESALYINHPCDNHQSVDWNLFLDRCTVSGSKPAIRMILNFYSPIDSQPFIVKSAKHAHLSLVKIFANLGSTKPDWNKALSCAAVNGCLDAVRFIADKATNLNEALREAELENFGLVSEYLLSRGARFWE